MKGQFVSIDTILSKLDRDLKREGISPSDVIEWSAEAIQAIGVNPVYEPAIRFAEVKNFHCDIPPLTKTIIQVAKRTSDKYIIPSEIPKVDEGVVIDEQGQPVSGYEIAYYRPFFDLMGEFLFGGAFKSVLPEFVPIRLTEHTYFDSIVCQYEGFENIYQGCSDEYTVSDGVLKFSFATGQVAISYLRMKVDCNGFPMIPDDYSTITAVTKYITMKLMETEFYAGRQGSENRLAKAEQDWHFYCRQSINKQLMPQSIDEWENLLHQWNYLLPRNNRYDNFFGNLAQGENRNKYFRN